MADTSRQPSVAWDHTTRPSAVWAELHQQAQTDEDRACLAAATRQADRVWIALHSGRLNLTRAAAATGGTAAAVVPRRDGDWHRLALSAHEVLRASGAYAHLAQLRGWACAAAEPVLSTWLASPEQPQPSTNRGGEAQVSVAQRLGIGDAVHHINGDTQAAHLSTLLSAAQDAAVFGIPGHRVELVTATTTHEGATVVRVVVDTPDGIALASQPMQLSVLVNPDARGVDAATAALRRVADIATDLFAQHARAVWHSPPPIPTLDLSATATGRAFPELRLSQRAAPPVPPTPTPGPGPAITPHPAPYDPNRTGRPR